MKVVGLALLLAALPMAVWAADVPVPARGPLQDVFPESGVESRTWSVKGTRKSGVDVITPTPLNRLQDVFPEVGVHSTFTTGGTGWEWDKSTGRWTEGHPIGCERRPEPKSALSLPDPNTTDRLAVDLNLTDDQMRNLSAALVSGHLSITEKREARDAGVALLRSVLLSANPSAARIEAAETAVARAESDLISTEVTAWMNVRTILTPDQMKKLAELINR